MNKSERTRATHSLLAQYNPFQGRTNYNKVAIRLVTDNFQGVSENIILYYYFILNIILYCTRGFPLLVLNSPLIPHF